MSASSGIPAAESSGGASLSDPSSSPGVKAARRGRWRTIALPALALIAVLAVALSLPVPVPVSETDVRVNTFLEGEAPSIAPPEDLDGFLSTGLWGRLPAVVSEQAPVIPLPEPTPAPAPAFEATTNPELQKIGFVGLIVTGNNSAMLLRGSSDDIARYGLGDALPDGRTLVSVSGNSLTLKNPHNEEEELLELFPRSIPDDPSSPPVAAPDAPAQ